MTISSLVRSSTSCVRLNWDFWHRGTMVCDKTSLPYWGCQPRSYAQRRNPKVLIWQRADSESGFFGWLWIAWIWAVGTWPKRTQSGWNNQKKKPLSTVISCYICTYSTPIFAVNSPYCWATTSIRAKKPPGRLRRKRRHGRGWLRVHLQHLRG